MQLFEKEVFADWLAAEAWRLKWGHLGLSLLNFHAINKAPRPTIGPDFNEALHPSKA